MNKERLAQMYFEGLSSTKKELLKQIFMEQTKLDVKTDHKLFYLWIYEKRIKVNK